MSFSVAAKISPATSSGCPYTAPSSPAFHPTVRDVGTGVLSEAPVRSGFWWYTGQLAVRRGLARGEGGGAAAAVLGAEGLGRARVTPPPQAATVSRRTTAVPQFLSPYEPWGRPGKRLAGIAGV